MIGWLQGIVRVRDPLSGIVILDAAGVGYQLIVSWQTFAEVPEVGEPCALWVHTHVREDALALYGFATPEEKQMFLLLTSVPQVGPKNAIGVLGGFPLGELIDAIAQSEGTTLERIPGVGKRTAERIILDLREKVERLRSASQTPLPGPGKKSPPAAAPSFSEDARAVLVNLGWKPKVVEGVVAKAMEDDPPPEGLDALVRRALALLMER